MPQRARLTQQGEPVTEQDKNAIKGNLVPIMISLAKPETSQLQVLIGDALATIAGYDFPERWPTLVDVSGAGIRVGAALTVRSSLVA